MKLHPNEIDFTEFTAEELSEFALKEIAFRDKKYLAALNDQLKRQNVRLSINITPVESKIPVA